MKQIEDSRWFKGALQYYVNWDGYDIHEKTWENASNLTNAPEAVSDFHLQFPDKPGPQASRRSAPGGGPCHKRALRYHRR